MAGGARQGARAARRRSSTSVRDAAEAHRARRSSSRGGSAACATSTEALGELLAQPYVAAKFAGDSKERAQALVRAIHDAMKRRARVAAVDGRGDAQGGAGEARRSCTTTRSATPTSGATYDFERDAATAYAKNALAATRFEQQRQLGKIGKPVDRTEWGMTPPTVNAYYDPSLNEIVLPGGRAPAAVLLEGLLRAGEHRRRGRRTRSGHELTHGFDDEGSQFDGDGQPARLVDEGRRRRSSTTATKCVQDQYSQYEAVPGREAQRRAHVGREHRRHRRREARLRRARRRGRRRTRRSAARSRASRDEQLFFLAYAQGWCSQGDARSSSRCWRAPTRTRRRAGASTARWPTSPRSPRPSSASPARR